MSDDFDIQSNDAVNKIHESMSRFVQEGSVGLWTGLTQLICVWWSNGCGVSRGEVPAPLRAVPTPKKSVIVNRASLRSETKITKCFLWVVFAQMLPDLSKYKTIVNHCKQCESELRDVEGLNFPFKIDEMFWRWWKLKFNAFFIYLPLYLHRIFSI